MSWTLWIIFGTVVGVIAGRLVGTRQSLVMNVIVGIVGAFMGGLIYVVIFPPGDDVMFEIPSVIASIVGTVLLLSVLRMVRRTT